MENNNSKILIVYYSLDGSTRLIANEIAEELKADILELKPIHDVPASGFMKYFWGGKQVMQKQKPDLAPYDKKAEDYDIIFMGTPVWASSYAPAFETFFLNTKLEGKKIALFCCQGGQPGKTFINMEQKLAGNDIISKIDFTTRGKDSKIHVEKAREWAASIIK